jgi:hypothetical protein
MIPGPDQLIACPYCGFLAIKHTLISSNTFGAILWSDGKQEAPMQPEFPAVVNCRGCKHLYWVYKAKVLGEIELFSNESEPIPKEWQHAKPIEHLTIDEYIEALSFGDEDTIDPEMIRHLRLHFWWAVNDIVRRNEKTKIAVPLPFTAAIEWYFHC